MSKAKEKKNYAEQTLCVCVVSSDWFLWYLRVHLCFIHRWVSLFIVMCVFVCVCRCWIIIQTIHKSNPSGERHRHRPMQNSWYENSTWHLKEPAELRKQSSILYTSKNEIRPVFYYHIFRVTEWLAIKRKSNRK